MYIMSSCNCKEIDKYAIEKLKIPSIILMENAANEIYLRIKNKYDKFLIICGTGNNGGDALAIGRKLLLNNYQVKIIIINPKKNYSSDFNINYEILKNLNSDIEYISDFKGIGQLKYTIKEYDVIIDGIFGVGLNRTLNEFYCHLINEINLSNKDILSIDVPSGLDCNEGIPLGNSIRANSTYTFEVIKKGFLNYKAIEYLGKIETISIGIPNEVKEKFSENVYIFDDDYYKGLIKKRAIYGHKGDYGKCVLVAGSLGFSGASYICTESCVKTGAGLTTLITTEECQKIVSNQLIEAMTINYTELDRVKSVVKNANVIAFGPGIRGDEKDKNILNCIIDDYSNSIVVDAEGINMLSRDKSLLKKLQDRVVLTPHLGEISRLVNKTIGEIEKDRINIAKNYAKDNRCVLVLKGYNTVITDGNKVYVNNTGSSKMATGGMGDCLTGIITSLIGQGYSKLNACLLGVYLHGKCGDIVAEDKYSVLATDIIKKIPFVMNDLI